VITHLIDALKGKHSLTTLRSSKWPEVRAKHLQAHPTCAVCGGKEKLEVHHKLPFHLTPALELDPENLITLCESNKGGVNCHLFFGHLGNFRSYNASVEQDVTGWPGKIKGRP
jgi:hypothetical protein